MVHPCFVFVLFIFILHLQPLYHHLVWYLCQFHLQLVHVGWMLVSLLGAFQNGWGLWAGQEGWVGLQSWWQEVGWKPAGMWKRKQPWYLLWYVQVRAYLCACVIYVCIHACVCASVSYTGGFVADGAVYVSHGFQDVEGDKSDLVEPITTLPPALGGFNHLSNRVAAVYFCTDLHRKMPLLQSQKYLCKTQYSFSMYTCLHCMCTLTTVLLN